ncbi:MAG: hypothetical protein HZB99_02480 [Candidatus Harrisonbacteria bacterium]|nr:hypothetical protein [Candidatus Harrisonbacteria bacterium]
MENINNRIDLENQIKDLKDKIKNKLRERGEAIREGGGWHENSAFDQANSELYVLESRLRELNELLFKML